VRKRGSFSLRINPFPARNLARKTKKPATESRFIQGRREYANPSGRELKPPSRLQPAPSPVINSEVHPGSWPVFLIKCSESGRKSHPAITRFTVGVRITRIHFSSVLPLFRKPLTILVSFSRFSKTGVSRSESGRVFTPNSETGINPGV